MEWRRGGPCDLVRRDSNDRRREEPDRYHLDGGRETAEAPELPGRDPPMGAGLDGDPHQNR